jgi:hypothetical protein
MTKNARTLLVLAAIAVGAGCSGNPVTLTPQRLGSPGSGATAHPTTRPTTTPAVTATPTSASTGTSSVDQKVTALNSVQTFYATLPHQNVDADLQALAAHMVSSKAFSSAYEALGGISATFPDGSPAIVFADKIELLGEPTPAARPRAPIPQATDVLTGPLSGPTQHEIAFLVNDNTGERGAFTPTRQLAYANAFINMGFAAAGYGVDAQDISLDTIVALGSNHPIDYLAIDTHGFLSYPAATSSPAGMARGVPNAVATATATPFYANLSDSDMDDASAQKYAADIAAGKVIASIAISSGKSGRLPAWGFTPAFLLENLKFNPGATVNNGSCWGANQLIFGNVAAAFAAAGVGRYNGWTKLVSGTDADQTDAYVFDRLLGEQSPSITGLDAYATQQNPAQRPFGLTASFNNLSAENRSGPLGTGVSQTSEAYNVSDYGDARNFTAPPFGSSAAFFYISYNSALADSNDALVVPSIATMAVAEGTPNSTLTLTGYFTSARGMVMDNLGSANVPLTVESWTNTQIVADLPPASSGLGGMITVVSPTNITGPAVPLTYWQGTLTYNETADISDFGDYTGSGMGSLSIPITVGIRADVAPMVPTIDASPVPQNLYISDLTPDSTGSLNTYQGTFSSSGSSPGCSPCSDIDPPGPRRSAVRRDGHVPAGSQRKRNSNARAGDKPFADTGTATITSSGPVALTPYVTSNYIKLSSLLNPVNAGANCNSAQAGPAASGGGNVACPGFGFAATNAGTCSDNQGGALCASAEDYGAQIGDPSSQYGDDQDYNSTPSTLVFTMNPATYTITVSSTAGMVYSQNFSDESEDTDTITGTFSAPVFPPAAASPAPMARVRRK